VRKSNHNLEIENQNHQDQPGSSTAIIGERINPTGRKAVLEALQAGNFDFVRKDALDQVAAGAAALDINAGVPGAIAHPADHPERG
jgi:5-methyltetrahydrofolate--homocysteine methyltransferase